MVKERNYFTALFSSSSIQIIRLLTSLLFSLWLANSLGAELFGEATILLVFANLIIFISSEGSRIAIFKFKIFEFQDLRKLISFTFFAGIFFSCIFLIYLFIWVGINNSLKIITIFFLISLTSIYQIFVSIHQLKDEFLSLGIKQFIGILVGIFAAVSNHVFSGDNLTLVIYILASYLSVVILSVLFNFREIIGTYKPRYKNKIKNTWLLKTSIFGSLGMLGNQMPLIVTEIFLTKTEFGIFALAWRIFEASYRSIVTILSQVFVPVISLSSNVRERGKEFLIASIVVIFAVSISSSFLKEFNELILIFLKGNWEGLNTRIFEFSAIMIILSVSSLSSQNIILEKSLNSAIKINFAKLILNSIFFFIFLKFFAINLFFSLLIIYFLETSLLILSSLHKENIKYYIYLIMSFIFLNLSLAFLTNLTFSIHSNLYISLSLNFLLWGILFLLFYFSLIKNKKILK